MSRAAILVVDDNPTNLKLVHVLLRSAGYEVRSALSAQDALRQLELLSPQLILMDIQLPDMNGLELTRQLKQDPRYQHIVIVALTAYAMKGDLEHAVVCGCSGYITKPINTRSFVDQVAAYLPAIAEGQV